MSATPAVPETPAVPQTSAVPHPPHQPQRRRFPTAPVGVIVDGPGPPLLGSIEDLLRLQDGVVSRLQLHELRETPAGLQRRLRRRELVRVQPGVYVDHNGPLSWNQRAWAAVLHAWPAALWGESVWAQTRPIHVAHARSRTVKPYPGVVFHAVNDLDDRTWWMQCPPRMKVEHAAVLAAAAARDEYEAIARLSDAVQRRLTSYDAISSALRQHSRLRRGRWLRTVLADLAGGANSVLEHEYLVRVERAHGLPVGVRQMASYAGGGRTERDVTYVPEQVVVELDGLMFHNTAAARDADLARDLAAAAVDDALTIRLGWGQVLRRPCRTAAQLAQVLIRRGWQGTATRCPEC